MKSISEFFQSLSLSSELSPKRPSYGFDDEKQLAKKPIRSIRSTQQHELPGKEQQHCRL